MSAKDRIPVTLGEYERLQAELADRLLQRKSIIEQVAEARSHGDLSENAEYEAARRAHSMNEGRIRELESAVSLAHVISDFTNVPNGVVSFGARVTLVNTDSGEEVHYQIVGRFGADVKRGRVSVESPIARAIVGKKVGDQVHVVTPGGEKSYDVRSVSYDHVNDRAQEGSGSVRGEAGWQV